MVEIGHVDTETVKLLRRLLEEDKTIEEATENIALGVYGILSSRCG